MMHDVKYRRPPDWDYKLEENGKYYGYPECCRRAFIDNGVNRTQAQLKVGNHGFFPCDHHAQEILAGKTTLAGLIKNRICATPFPND